MVGSLYKRGSAIERQIWVAIKQAVTHAEAREIPGLFPCIILQRRAVGCEYLEVVKTSR